VEGERIYYGGDTDLIPEMKDVKADIVILPVGGTYTMTAEEAARAADLIQPKTAIPIHYDDIVGSAADAKKFKELCKVPVEIKPVTNP
jgi:L-ascorbate metabolism protein UlaG (beta-lactamase superfamily)